MVRRGGRSRGCKNCRQRKIKCDEAEPECSQCHQSGRVCAGPVTGLIFIFTGDAPRKSSPSLTKLENGSATSHIEMSRRQSSSSSEDFSLPPAAPQLVARATEQCVLGCFMSSYHTSFVQWPIEHMQNPSTPALKFAIRAGTMAFYGNLTKNTALQIDAGRWYSKAIELVVAQLAVKDSERRLCAKLASPEVLLTRMTFALFESALSTSPMGWVHHLVAAATLLEELGPQCCQVGTMHDIFRAVRLNMVYITTISLQPCAFASEDWLTIPFLGRSKLPMDELVDILLCLPICLSIEAQLDILNMDVAEDIVLHQELSKQLFSQLQYPVENLARWWNKYHGATIDDKDNSATSAPSLAAQPQDLYSSPMDATLRAYYSSAQIITNHLVAVVAPSKRLVSDELIIHQGSVVLSAVAYHRTYGIFSGGTFVMIYPLKTALFRSPSPEQRQDSIRALLEWGQERGVEGVCVSGLAWGKERSASAATSRRGSEAVR